MPYQYYLSKPLEPYEVIDGDSIRVLLDLGNRTYSNMICRLMGIDAPERHTDAGRLVKDVVVRWMREAGPEAILVRSVQLDKFAGRFDGVIEETRGGSILNSFLLFHGLAREYRGDRRTDWSEEELDSCENAAIVLLARDNAHPLVP